MQDTCTPMRYVCQVAYEECSSAPLNTVIGCPQNQVCDFRRGGACIDPIAANATCDTNFGVDDCVSGLACGATNGNESDYTCQPLVSVKQGDTCDDELRVCNSARLSCVSGVCTTLPTLGEACTDFCAGLYTCGPALTCIQIGSVATGGACYSTADCAANNFCNQTGDSGVCAVGITQPAGVACDYSDTSKCQAGAYCGCVGSANASTCIAPEVYTSSYVSSAQAFQKCVYDNDVACLDSTSDACAAACKSSYCPYTLKSLQDDGTPFQDVNLTCFHNAVYDKYCGSASSEGTMLAPLALSLTLLFMLF